MTVGEALAEARYRAGLTLHEISERTMIREAVIQGIEHDDYGPCGGELYVRGYVRAIAGAIGIDAQPLIREYDGTRANASAPLRPAAPPPVRPAAPAPARPVAVTRPEAALAMTTVDLVATTPPLPVATAPVRATTPLMRVATQPVPVPAQGQPRQPARSQPRQPAQGQPRQPSAWRVRARGRRSAGIAALAALALAAVGIAVGVVVTSPRHAPARNTVTAAGRQPAARHAGAPGSAAGTTGANAATAPSASGAHAGATAPRPATAAPGGPLTVKLAAAFGPAGIADGDNPQSARFAIARDATLPWRTDWYTTPEFGLLKHGTGLLLDMGRTVTITSVRLYLGPYAGADLQLRTGGAAAIGDLRVAARASGVGGTVLLQLRSPARARYLLIWFTLLPPNGTGRYQASVYRVVVNGRP